MRPFSVAVLVALAALPATTLAFSESRASQRRLQRGHYSHRKRRRSAAYFSTATPESSTEGSSSSSFSNFWYSVVQKDDEKDGQDRIPCVRNLDRDGPLPPGAYLEHCRDTVYESKPICRVTVAIDLTQGFDTDGDFDVEASEVVIQMQKFLDAGLTSFQLKSSRQGRCVDDSLQEWGEEHIFGRLRKETPAFALKQCHLVLPYEIPGASAVGTVTPASIRKTVLAALDRTGGECIDTLQLSQQQQQDSPYALDVLDCLQDLQREGYLRSVAGKSLPWTLLRQADQCGYRIDSNQVDGNILNPVAFDNPEQELACNDLGTKLLVASPLAGGLLSGRHYAAAQAMTRRRGRERTNAPTPFTPSEWYHLKHTMVHWGDHRDDLADDATVAERWKLYQDKVLFVLHDIATKHGVSMSTIALRWTLQADHVASAVVTCRLLGATDDSWEHRPQQLRQVFSVELDEEDMGRLWEVAGRVVPEPMFRDQDEEDLYMEMMESDKGLLLPSKRKPPPSDRSSRTLWL